MMSNILIEMDLENHVMSTFVRGVDSMVQEPPRREHSVLQDSLVHAHHMSSTPNPDSVFGADDSVSLYG